MKNKRIWLARAAAFALCLMMLSFGSAVPAMAEESASEAARQMTEKAFEQMKKAALEDPQRVAEVTPDADSGFSLFNEETGESFSPPMNICTIELNGHRMLYNLEIVGEPDESGLYPLYICLHGGGGSDTPDVNNNEWYTMTMYYRESVESGIYVCPRGMEDVWNLHFLEESYPMYDRLIEDMVLLKNADPNRVYLLGFSAGGDGVYGVAPRMADRFAAVNMSSGHPNGISLLNTANLPFEIQTGIRDFYNEDALRSIRNAEFEEVLNGYREQYGCPYTHRVLVHVPAGHNYVDHVGTGDGCVLKDPAEFARRAEKEKIVDQFLKLFYKYTKVDDVISLSYDNYYEEFNEALKILVTKDLGLEVTENENTNAVTWVTSFKRDPVPEKLVWDLSTRASSRRDTAYYWLRADFSVNAGVIQAAYDMETNTVTVKTDGKVNGAFSILANPFLMDFDRPLRIVTDSGEYTENIKADPEVIARALNETGDPFLAWSAEIPVR